MAWLLALGLMAGFLTGCWDLFGFRTVDHLALGNPSLADTTNVNNYLISRPQYVLSYNQEKGTANWASWQLNKSWLGNSDRQDNFRADDSLAPNFYKATSSDYNNSGYDRGHLVPSADRTNSDENNSATFLMTNIVPQAPDNNRGPWAELEKYSRSLVDQGKELYVIAGVAGKKQAIAKGKIIVPDQTWKIIVVLDQPGTGAKGVSPSTRVIAVNIPNNQGIKSKNWQSFRVSVDSLQKLTGYDFLRTVNSQIQAVLESKVDRL